MKFYSTKDVEGETLETIHKSNIFHRFITIFLRPKMFNFYQKVHLQSLLEFL